MSAVLSIDEIQFVSSHQKIFLACSGGSDSMVLAHQLLTNSIPFSIAHCNFKLREKESETDFSFVADFCTKNNIPFHSISVDTKAEMKKNNTSLEVEARNIRYRFFDKLIEEHTVDLFLTAHHLDDNIETVTMRLLKGSGTSGLKGIPKQRGVFYRPLLNASKEIINQYAIDNDVNYRTDKSNDDISIQRNYIRHELIPKFSRVNSNYHQAFQKFVDLQGDVNALLFDSFESLKLEFQKKRKIDIFNYSDKQYLSLMLYYVFEDYTPNNEQIYRLKAAIGSEECKKITIGSTLVEVKGSEVSEVIEGQMFIAVMIDKLEDFKMYYDVELLDKDDVSYEKGKLYLDSKKINYPVTHRLWKDGDTIKPLGLDGKSKKVSKILTEQKLTTSQKSQIVVLEDNNSQIIAIPFICISELVKVEDESREVLVIA